MSNDKCQSCREAIEAVDREIIKLRSILVRVRNIASGKDGDMDASDIVSLCDYVMSDSTRVVGKDILTCSDNEPPYCPLSGL